MARLRDCESDWTCRTCRRNCRCCGLWLAEPAIPIILGLAAGAMLFVISNEVIPETHRGPDKNLATFSLLTGVALMLLLSVLLK